MLPTSERCMNGGALSTLCFFLEREEQPRGRGVSRFPQNRIVITFTSPIVSTRAPSTVHLTLRTWNHETVYLSLGEMSLDVAAASRISGGLFLLRLTPPTVQIQRKANVGVKRGSESWNGHESAERGGNAV